MLAERKAGIKLFVKISRLILLRVNDAFHSLSRRNYYRVSLRRQRIHPSHIRLLQRSRLIRGLVLEN